MATDQTLYSDYLSLVKIICIVRVKRQSKSDMKPNVARLPSASSVDKPNRKSEKSKQTQQKLLDAGGHLFSTYGYNATTTRNVEIHAEVQRNLIAYHFGSKEAFWKVCVSQVFDRFGKILQPALDQARDIEPGERIRFIIRKFVRASAAYPEVMCFMFDEGRCADWRLSWIVDQYTREFHRTMGELLEDSGAINELTHMQFYYLLVSSGAMFSMAPEYRLLSSEEPCNDAMVDAQADAIAQLLAPNTSRRSS